MSSIETYEAFVKIPRLERNIRGGINHVVDTYRKTLNISFEFHEVVPTQMEAGGITYDLITRNCARYGKYPVHTKHYA